MVKNIVFTFLVFVFALFLLLFGFRNQVQSLISFPAVLYNTLDIQGYSQSFLDFEDIYFTNSQNNIIHGIFIDNQADKTVYYFHGNGGPLEYFYNELQFISDLGYNVMSYDYPGYGKSEGFPDDVEVFTSSQEFYDFVSLQYDIVPEDTIIWGHSIGSAVATDFAYKNEISHLILMSPLYSRYKMSEYYFGFIVQKLLFLPDSLENYEKIKKISVPTLIIHGDEDTIVPFGLGKEVYKNSGGTPKIFVALEQFGHNFILDERGEYLRPIIQNFLSHSVESIETIEIEKLDGVQSKIGETSKKFVETRESLEENKILQEADFSINKNQNQEISPTIQKTLSYFQIDDSVQKFVGPDLAFDDLGYIPNDLSRLQEVNLIDQKKNSQLRLEAAEALYDLAEDFYREFGEKIVVVSAYRSYNYQKGIKDRGCPDTLCSKAGHSEHQSGLAVDFFETTDFETFLSKPHLKKYFEWLNARAHTYGYHNSYHKGQEIDGYEKEPWHWRYVGEELATYLKKSQLSFTELYYLRNSDEHR